MLDSYAEERASERDNYFKMFAGSPVSQLNKDKGKSRWKISKSHNNAHILRRLFSLFIKEIVEGMIGYVHLPSIMSKLLSDNGSQEFGDFKLTILGMLGTYGFERRILVTFCTFVLPFIIIIIVLIQIFLQALQTSKHTNLDSTFPLNFEATNRNKKLLQES